MHTILKNIHTYCIRTSLLRFKCTTIPQYFIIVLSLYWYLAIGPDQLVEEFGCFCRGLGVVGVLHLLNAFGENLVHLNHHFSVLVRFRRLKSVEWIHRRWISQSKESRRPVTSPISISQSNTIGAGTVAI